jgi:hypothetical protein
LSFIGKATTYRPLRFEGLMTQFRQSSEITEENVWVPAASAEIRNLHIRKII